MKVKRNIRKFQPDFWHYVKKIKAKVKKWFSCKKSVYFDFDFVAVKTMLG